MRIVIPLLAISLGMSSPIFAQSESTSDGNNSGVINLGAFGLLSSEYLGADDEKFRALPYISLSDVKNFDLFGTSLDYRLIEKGTGAGLGKWSLRAGPNISYQAGRDSDDSETLTGLEDIDGSLLAGGFIRGSYGPVGIRFNAGQDIIGGHNGLTADFSVGTFLPLGRLNFQPSASVSWGSSSHNESFFGITQAQSTASGLAINDVSSGIYAYSANLVSWYQITDKYSVSVIGTYRWFTDEADDSPIILAADGSDTNIFIGVGISRRFKL